VNPVPPEALAAGVGHGDFARIGAETVALIGRFANLHPDDRILDVGSGLGRIALPLSAVLNGAGSYDGLDTVADYIRWCTEQLGLDPERFRFHHADLFNSFYNPGGAVRPEHYRFPWPDRTFTLTIATSLFTHLHPDAAANYVRECFRTLAPGGRLFASFFVLDAHSRDVIKFGTNPPFGVEIEHGMISDAANPDFAIALDADWLLHVFLDAGFEIQTFAPGSWRYIIPEGPMYQDLVIARRSGG
jgi:SAM-dependent methyltransferase